MMENVLAKDATGLAFMIKGLNTLLNHQMNKQFNIKMTNTMLCHVHLDNR